jgi:putative transposase
MMRKSKFTESQIVATLKQVEGGRQVKDVCRELGVSDATYYVWKSKYGGMEAADLHRLRDLEAERRHPYLSSAPIWSPIPHEPIHCVADWKRSPCRVREWLLGQRPAALKETM